MMATVVIHIRYVCDTLIGTYTVYLYWVFLDYTFRCAGIYWLTRNNRWKNIILKNGGVLLSKQFFFFFNKCLYL